jgi:hypothetical protein
MTTTAHEDQYAPEPVNDNPKRGRPITTAEMVEHYMPLVELYARLMHAERDTKADSDGDDGA